MQREIRIIFFTAVCLLIWNLAESGAGENWPQFRGPQSAGVADGTNLPERWSEKENVAWAVAIPGRGWSSPIVWGKRIFVTSAVSGGKFKEPSTGIYGNDYIAELQKQGLSPEEVMKRVRSRDIESSDEVSQDIRWMVYCLDVADGRILWQRQAHLGKPFGGRHRKNTYASETPVTDGERVYAYFGNVGLFCYSMEGELLWTRRWEPHNIYLDFGTASSPALHGDRVYILNDNQEESFLAAVDKRTGHEIWRTPRTFGNVQIKSTFTTPYVWQNNSRTEIVTLGPGTLVSYDLNGKELWRFKGTSVVGAPTPLSKDGLLYAGSGAQGESPRPIFAIRPGASGDISLKQGEEANEHVAWYQSMGGPYITSPVAFGKNVYVLYDTGLIGAFDALTGKQIYKARIGEGAHAFSSSPWAYNGKVYCLSEDGDTYVIEAGDTFKLLGKNSLNEMSLATPAIAQESLFIRTATKLYRIKQNIFQVMSRITA